MKKYTSEELYEILRTTADAKYEFDKKDRDRVLENPLLKERIAQLVEDGERFRGHRTMEIPFSAFKRFEIDGNRTDFEYSEYGYFIRRKKLTTYAILSWLYEKEEDIRELEDIIFAICNEYTWALPAHLHGTGLSRLQSDGYEIDLFASECAASLAEILSLLGDKLSPIIKKRILHEIKVRILDIADSDFRWNNGTLHSNWVSVCNGNCGIAAIYAENDTVRLSEILSSCINSLEYFWDSFTDDGVCSEGVGYWTYGFGFFTYFADILKKRTGGKIDLFDDEKARLCAEFYGKCFFTEGNTVSFADMWDERLFAALPGLSCYLKNIYADSYLPHPKKLDFSYPQNYRARFIRDLREFLWVDERVLSSAKELRETFIFPTSQWYISTSENGVSIAAKGGHNAEAHNHNDVGSFTLFKNGVRAIDDFGACEYVKDYFREKRYSFFNTSSASHNVPVINGNFQKNGRDFAAKDVVIREDGMRMDIAGAYGEESLQRLVRDLAFDKKSGKLILTDEYEFSKSDAVDVSERFVSLYEPKIHDGFAYFGNGEEGITLRYDSNSLIPEISKDTFRRHDGSGEIITAYILDLRVRSEKREFKVKIEFE